MLLVIQTQDYENYAAHQGFTGETHWKAKGGSEYKIRNVPQDANVSEVILMADIEQNNDYFITSVVGWDWKEDDYLSSYEQSQLEYDGVIHFPEPVLDYAELIRAHTPREQYLEEQAAQDAVYYGA